MKSSTLSLPPIESKTVPFEAEAECGECGSTYPVTAKNCFVCGAKARKAAKTERKTPPTIEQFRQYQAAYDYFNKVLFEDELKPCLLVFREGRISKLGKVMGHFCPNRWRNQDGRTVHEISLNPEVLYLDLETTMATLVHEMVHQRQQDHGTPIRRCYHDKQWAAKMLEVGLTPSSTSAPGGKMTGQSMGHYITAGGAFETAFKSMPEAIALPWVTGSETGGGKGKAVSEEGEEGEDGEKEAKKKSSKTKYSCECGNNVWGKPGLKLTCGDCDAAYRGAD